MWYNTAYGDDRLRRDLWTDRMLRVDGR